MTALARYAGPLRPFVGAIGWLADGGAVIAGRLVRGRTVVPIVEVSHDGVTVAAFNSWQDAREALALWLDAVDRHAAGLTRMALPGPGGMSVVVNGVEYRLTVS